MILQAAFIVRGQSYHTSRGNFEILRRRATEKRAGGPGVAVTIDRGGWQLVDEACSRGAGMCVSGGANSGLSV